VYTASEVVAIIKDAFITAGEVRYTHLSFHPAIHNSRWFSSPGPLQSWKIWKPHSVV
jgi:hypothetical protein